MIEKRYLEIREIADRMFADPMALDEQEVYLLSARSGISEQEVREWNSLHIMRKHSELAPSSCHSEDDL